MALLETDVAVVGSGPGGLAVALALEKVFAGQSGFSVTVFDKARAFRNVGAAIGFLANGQSALEAIDPKALKAVLSRSAEFKETTFYNTVGEAVSTRPREAGGMVLVPWYDVQKTLMDIAVDAGINIHTGHRFASLEQDDTGVTVRFENGTAVRCKVLIGADGALSAVRAAALGPPDRPAAYTGISSCRAIVDQPPWWPFPDTLVGFNGQFLVLPLLDGKLSWGCQATYPEELLSRPKDSELAKQWCLDICRLCGATPDGPYPYLHRLVEETPASSILMQYIYGRESMGPLTPWGNGRVTLVGDAAHVIHPALGQGTGLAFEDAAELAYAVAEHGLCLEALRAYENTRLGRLQDFADLTHASIMFQKAQVAASGRFTVDHLKEGSKLENVPKLLTGQERTAITNRILNMRFRPVQPARPQPIVAQLQHKSVSVASVAAKMALF